MSTIAAQKTGLGSYAELVKRNPNLRQLWFGQIVSLLGDWFNLIASAALVTSLTESGLAVGGLFVVRMLSPFLISPLAGIAADRYNRKHLLIAADIGRGIVVLGFLFVREPQHIPLLYGLTAVQLGLSGFFFPARNAILPDLVEREDLGTANALTAVTWSVMLAFGAALGGIVAGLWGVYLSFLIDAATFIVSAYLVGQIVYTRPPSQTGAGVRDALTAYADGMRYLRRTRDVLMTVLLKAALAFCMAAPFDVLQVRITEDVFVIGKGGGAGLGLMFATIGVGTGVGPLVARRFSGDAERAQRLVITLAFLTIAGGLVIIAPLASFEVVLLGTLVRGFGGGTVWVFSTQLLLQNVPDHVRGRVFATEFMLFTLFYAISASLSGWLLETTLLSYSGMLWLLVIANLVPAALWTWWNTRRAHPAHHPVS